MLFDLFRNYLNALVGRNQEFEKLLAAKDISAVKERMDNRMDMAIAALKEYEVTSHEIMKREDKIITDKKGNFIRLEPVWKLPIPYQVYINEIALVFLYGRPVKWTQQSTGTDRAFQKFQDVIERTHFNSKLRQCKRIAGSETESAMLFRVFRDANDAPDVQIRVLAKSKGDEIYTRWDQYENLISIAWGYYVREQENSLVYHFDIYTPNIIYRCTRKSIGWEVVEEVNFIGKIPLILFQQDKEWNGVETLIHREELIGSRTADTNDYFADPIAIMAADLIKNLPEKKEAAKLLVTNDSEGVDKAAKYLTWDSAPESKKQEIEWLQNHILSKSFTPNISLDTLKSLSNLSGKALRTVMLLADIKAGKIKRVVVKDMSRFGRNYLQVGMYTEMLFPEYGVHFIAVNDGVDSVRGDSEFTAIRNVFNEMYAKDTSKKIRATWQSKGRSGEHLTTIPPYGYKKDPENKKRWIVDEEAAAVVGGADLVDQEPGYRQGLGSVINVGVVIGVDADAVALAFHVQVLSLIHI